MRAVSLVVITGLLAAAAAPAQALSISPNPVSEVRSAGAPGGSLSANLSALNVSGNTATFQLSVVTGSIVGIDIGLLFSGSTFNFVTSASFAGSGIGGTASLAAGGTQAQFDFAGTGIGAGQSSQQLVVTFVSPIQVAWTGTANFDNGFVTTRQYTIVGAPEPATLLLLGLALAGSAAARRRTGT